MKRPSARFATGIATVTVLLVFGATPGAWSHSTAKHQHDGWVKHTVLEYAGITTTEVLIAQQYYQDTSRVWNPRYDGGRCYHNYTPGWQTLQCTRDIDNNQYTSVTIEVWGSFAHPSTNISYVQYAWNRAYGNNDFKIHCEISSGSIPSGWRTDCKGGRNGPSGSDGQ
jgi:hypothetical protein